MVRGRDDDPSAKLGALLEPLLGGLAARAPDPEPEPEPRRRLNEAELMGLIFASLDDDNPRVCDGIDFDRLRILSEVEPPLPEPVEPASLQQRAAAGPPRAAGGPQQAAGGPQRAPAGPKPVLRSVAIEASDWVGRGWSDDIKTIPAELLDRPTPTPAWRALRARAEARPLNTLNLRHLGRATALRHLELFIHACRARRHRLCRVITGKGIDSQADPVLKRAVIEWCLGARGDLGPATVLTWAPYLDRHGEWGALILELRSVASAGTKPP